MKSLTILCHSVLSQLTRCGYCFTLGDQRLSKVVPTYTAVCFYKMEMRDAWVTQLSIFFPFTS